MHNIYLLLPELVLFTSICFLLVIGVFIKESFNLISNLSVLTLLIVGLLIYKSGFSNQGFFLESFVSDPLSNFSKIMIVLSCIFIKFSSKQFIKDRKITKFEYPIIILLSILGMFFMVSSNDLILFYLGLELQSLSLYILAFL